MHGTPIYRGTPIPICPSTWPALSSSLSRSHPTTPLSSAAHAAALISSLDHRFQATPRRKFLEAPPDKILQRPRAAPAPAMSEMASRRLHPVFGARVQVGWRLSKSVPCLMISKNLSGVMSRPGNPRLVVGGWRQVSARKREHSSVRGVIVTRRFALRRRLYPLDTSESGPRIPSGLLWGLRLSTRARISISLQS